MRRAALLCLPVALLATGCSTTVAGSASPAPTSSSPTSSSSAPAESDDTDEPSTEDLARARNLVDELYVELSSATEGGLSAYALTLVTGNHPEFIYSSAECLTFLQALGLTDTYRAVYSPDLEGLEPDPGWELPDGRYAGLAPEGDIYTVPLTVDESDSATGYADSYSATVHAVVLDDEAYYFQPCEQ